MEQKSQTEEQILVEKVYSDTQEVAYRKYIKGKLLGRGGFAKCYQGVVVDTQEKVAIKVIEKSNLIKNRAKQKLLSEIKIHKMLKHKYIVKFLSVFEDSKNIYIMLELCVNNALSDLVRRRKRLSIMEVRRFIQQIVQAVKYMHSLRVIHRDLKMANIFLDQQMNIKVGDLGLAAKLQFPEEKKRTMCGTPNYIAPEIILGGNGHSYQVDIWSIGVICYAMFYGRPPFETTDVKRTYQKIKSAQFQFPDIDGLTSQFKDFIGKLLKIDPKMRLTIQQIQKHPFFIQPNSIMTYNTQQSEQLRTTLTPVYDSQRQIIKTITQDNPLKWLDEKQKHTTTTLKPFSTRECDKNKSGSSSSTGSSLWSYINIVCYVDYSTKYGLGYILSNNTYGVYYNDSSLLYHNQIDNMLYYIQNPSVQEEKIQKYSVVEASSIAAITKKYLLLKKFKIYLDDEMVKSKEPIVSQNVSGNQVYVRQWLKTKHAIMFRLSNKIFQVDFFDGSRISLKTDTKYLLVRSKIGEVKMTTLQDALSEKNTQTSRRIKYIKQILKEFKNK